MERDLYQAMTAWTRVAMKRSLDEVSIVYPFHFPPFAVERETTLTAKTYITRAESPAIELMTARPVFVATAALFCNPSLPTRHVVLSIELPSS